MVVSDVSCSKKSVTIATETPASSGTSTSNGSKTMKSVRINVNNGQEEVSTETTTTTTTTSSVKLNKKKSVSFKTTLETSDDKNIVKKVYNPDNNAPLVPIIKRRFNGLGKTTCIVRPSRLTDVLQKNNESSSIIKAASLFSSVSVQSLDTDRLSSAGLRYESPKKGLYSCRIIKSNKRLLGYPRELLKKFKSGKTSLSKINQYLNSGEHLEGIEDGGKKKISFFI